MRIICPNCDAQYEVPDEVVPPEGRDVQCSNCGTTWFLHHPSNPRAAEQSADIVDVVPEPQPVEDTPAEDEDYQETPVDAPSPQQMDPAVEDILRQEAEREQAARHADAAPLEIQDDLGLDQGEDEAEKRAREARERMARMRGEQPEGDLVSEGNGPVENVGEAAATAAAVGSRRELLPDIEEINSTLRSTGDREVAGDDPAPEAPIRGRRKRGFRRGLSLAFLVFVIALLVYVFADRISQNVPAAAPYLDMFTNWVDGLRGWVDESMKSLLRWLDQIAADTGG